MKKFFIYTFGCKVNQYESQIIRERFLQNGYQAAVSCDEAGLIIINSCTVTDRSDKECDSLIKKLVKKNKEIVLTGCYAKISKKELSAKFPEIKLVQKRDFLKNSKQFIKSFDNHSRAFLKIQDGCDSFCSYCIVPYARNVLWSKPENEITAEINSLTDNGYSEIVLTGIHIGKYDKGITPLIKKILFSVKKDFRLRLSSIEMNEVDEKLIELMANEPLKICNHIHLPLQSGSDNVLKQMGRNYKASDFKKSVSALQKNIPAVAVTTDVICGFPTETEKDFENTYKFIKNNNFARLHVFTYSKRKGTEAYDLPQTSDKAEIHERVSKLLEMDKNLREKFYGKFCGTIRKAVSLRGNLALTDNYLTVKNIPGRKGIFDVKIV